MSEHIEKAPHVPPFVTFVTSAVPMVFDNSLSYYEALCALWKWLQDDVVNVINNNATVTEDYIDLTNEYIEKFNELKEYVDTYFDNLDVQEEINNKLDAMVEDGTLQELINAYLQPNVAWTFDTVADMKASTNLIDGTYARTLGYYSVNDGGGALYKISDTGIANEKDVIAIGSTLYAQLIYGEHANVMQFGAYGDNTHDDSAVINYVLANFSDVYFPDKNYAVASTIEVVRSNQTIKCDGSLNYSGSSFAVIFKSGIDNNIFIRHIESSTGGGVLVQPTSSCGRVRLDVSTMNVNAETFKVTGNRATSSWYLKGIRWNSISSYAINFDIPSGSSGVFYNRFLFEKMALITHTSDSKGILLTNNSNSSCDIQVQFTEVNFEGVKGIRTTGQVGFLSITNCRLTEIATTEWFEVNGYVPNGIITGAGRVFLQRMHFNNIVGGEELILNIRAQDTGLYAYSGYTYNGGSIKRTADNHVVFVPDDNNNTHYVYIASTDECTVGDEDDRDLSLPFVTPYQINVANAGATTTVNIPSWVYLNRSMLRVNVGHSTTTVKYSNNSYGPFSGTNKCYLLSNSNGSVYYVQLT